MAHVDQYEDAMEQTLRTGLSSVRLEQPHGKQLVKDEFWVSDLVYAVTKLFDCRAFHEQAPLSILWTFYGVADHTVAAAMAFEVMHFLILDRSASLVGVSTRNSYCQGAARGFCRIANKEVLFVERQAKENEEKAMVTQIEREREAEAVRLQRLQPWVGDSCNEDLDSNNPHDGHIELDTTVSTSSISKKELDETQCTPDHMDKQGSPTTPEDDEVSWNGFSDSETDTDDDLYIEGPWKENDLSHGFASSGIGNDPSFDAAEDDFEENLQRFTDDALPIQNRTPLKQSSDHDKGACTSPVPAPQPASPVITIAPIDLEDDDLLQWKNIKQLALYRQSSKDACDTWLEENNIKLYNAVKRKRTIRDYDAYQQGEKESRDIHAQAKRQRIEG